MCLLLINSVLWSFYELGSRQEGLNFENQAVLLVVRLPRLSFFQTKDEFWRKQNHTKTREWEREVYNNDGWVFLNTRLTLVCLATLKETSSLNCLRQKTGSPSTITNEDVLKPLFRAQELIVQELCESRGGRPGLSVLTSRLVSVDVKIYCTVLRHWSQLVPNMSHDIWGH